GFRLHDNAEGAPVQVEVVNIETTKVRLQGLKGIRNGHTEDLATLAIQIEPQLRLSDREGGCDTPDLRAFPRRLKDQVGRLRQGGHILAAAILNLHVEAAGRSQTLDRRYRIGDNSPPLNGRKAGARLVDERTRMQRFVVALFPWFQDHKQRTQIRPKDVADQAL